MRGVVVALVDLDAAGEDLAAQPADVEPAGVAAGDALVHPAEEQVVDVDAAEAVLDAHHPVVGGRRPAGVLRRGVDLPHRDVPQPAATGHGAGECEGGEAGAVDQQPGALRRATRRLCEAHALQPHRGAVQDDGRGDAVGAGAELQRAAAARLQVVDRGLEGGRVVGGAVALGAVVPHMRAAVGEHGGAELRHGGAAGLVEGAVGLDQRREVGVAEGVGLGEFADSGVGHGGPFRAGRGAPGVGWGGAGRRTRATASGGRRPR
jgi:hypothetical protein